MPITAILTDIEGTTTPISFVHDHLFPYARTRLAAFIAAHSGREDVAAALAEVAALAPGQDATAVLLGWMAEDAKVTPLKTLQGLIWQQGYASGAIKGALYPDVAPSLRRWQRAGLVLCVYSSGSVAAQRLLFAHSVAGDLGPLFAGYFDTTIGPKREAESYRRIAAKTGRPAGDILFLSDIGAELDAAAAAGLATCQLLRPQDGTQPAAGHPHAADFTAVGAQFGLG